MPREGEKNGRAKLTEAQVAEIREIYSLFGGRMEQKDGANNNRVTSTFKLALEYDVAVSTMRSILTGETWKHVKYRG